MTAIYATTQTAKYLRDGTARIVIDVDASSARQAMDLFGMPGSPLGIARLASASAADQEARKEREAGKRIGPLCTLAVRWCKSPVFQEWVALQATSSATTPDPEGHAAEWLKTECRIGSRKDLDTDPTAGPRFHAFVRKPFMEHCERIGVEP